MLNVMIAMEDHSDDTLLDTLFFGRFLDDTCLTVAILRFLLFVPRSHFDKVQHLPLLFRATDHLR